MMEAGIHALERIHDRTRMVVKDVIAIIGEKAGVTLGEAEHEGEQVRFFLFYSPPDNATKIALIGKRDGEDVLVSVWEDYFFLPRTVRRPTGRDRHTAREKLRSYLFRRIQYTENGSMNAEKKKLIPKKVNGVPTPKPPEVSKESQHQGLTRSDGEVFIEVLQGGVMQYRHRVGDFSREEILTKHLLLKRVRADLFRIHSAIESIQEEEVIYFSPDYRIVVEYRTLAATQRIKYLTFLKVGRMKEAKETRCLAEA